MPKEIFRDLKKTWVAGQMLKISRENDAKPATGKRRPAFGSAGEGPAPAGKKKRKRGR